MGAAVEAFDATELAREVTVGGLGAIARGEAALRAADLAAACCWFASHLRRSAAITSAWDARPGPRVKAGGDALRPAEDDDATEDGDDVLAFFPAGSSEAADDEVTEAVASLADSLDRRERLPTESVPTWAGSHGGDKGWYGGKGLDVGGAIRVMDAGSAAAACCCCCWNAATWDICA